MKIKKKLSFFLKIPWFAGRHAFLACLIIFLIALLFGALIFYQNYLIVRNFSIGTEERNYFDKESYNKLMDYWHQSEERYNQADSKVYSNPFGLTSEKK